MDNAEQLPPGIEVPKRYARTITNRHLFITGAQDALAGQPRPAQDDFTRQQGAAAWVPYALGYQAGRRWQARQGRLPSRFRRE